MGLAHFLCLIFLIFSTSMAVRKCMVYPIPHAGGQESLVDCTTNPGHDYAASGCFYRRYTDDSGMQAGFIEGGCGASMCRSGKAEKCRLITETEDIFSFASKFCCCYGEHCNNATRAEALM